MEIQGSDFTISVLLFHFLKQMPPGDFPLRLPIPSVSAAQKRKSCRGRDFPLAFCRAACYNRTISKQPEILLKVLRILMVIAVILLAVLTLILCVANDLFGRAREELRLFRAEWGEIREFFGKDREPPAVEAVRVRAAEPDGEQACLLDRREHIEVIPSAYNDPSKPSSVARLGEAVIVRPPDTGTVPAVRYGYEAIPRFTDMNAASVSAVLAGHGIEVRQIPVKNPAPSGEVFAIRYAGTADENGYYVNPEVPVTLYVSGAKKAVVQPDQTPVICLTFDDGPTENNTGRLLDILDTYGVKASFFTIGESVRKYPSSARAIHERGHILGCHTVTHVYTDIYRSADALKTEVLAWEGIAANAGIPLSEPKYFRFPGGSVGNYLDESSAEEMKTMLSDLGYLVFDWNAATNDAVLFLREDGEDTYDYIRKTFLANLEQTVRELENREGVPIILLMHETVGETVDLMPWMLEYLIREGYSFANLDSCGRSLTFADR